jgi:hypothetical protein
MQMKIVFLYTALTGAVIACSSPAPALTAQDQVQSACQGYFKNPGACVKCVVDQTETMMKSGQIPGEEAGQIRSFFASGACKGACMPTSCAIEGQVCGTLFDRCNNTITCGPVCHGGPKLVQCICNDGTPLEMCGTLDCSLSSEIDAICGPLCAPHGGEARTGCFDINNSCVP